MPYGSVVLLKMLTVIYVLGGYELSEGSNAFRKYVQVGGS